LKTLFFAIAVVGATTCRSERSTPPLAAPASSSKEISVTYVGSERCSGCHARAYAEWKTGEPAKAVALLSRVHERFDGDRAVTDLLARYRSETETPRGAPVTHHPP
jgi:hypothetical protein